VPKLAALMASAEADVLAFMVFPKEHRAKLHSTNPLERLNGEIKRRIDVVGISRMKPPSRVSSAPFCWNRTTNGPCNAAT
jgi:transposase-like protein